MVLRRDQWMIRWSKWHWLNRCTNTDIHVAYVARETFSLGSPDATVKRPPTAFNKSNAEEWVGPWVWNASGWKNTGGIIVISATRTEWMAEIMCSFDVCVYLSVCTQRTGQSDQFKAVKAIRTSNLTRVFPGTVRTWPLIFSKMVAWPGSRDLLNFWVLNANNSKTVKASDFKYDMLVSGTVRTWPLKIFRKGGSVKIHLAKICTLTSAF